MTLRPLLFSLAALGLCNPVPGEPEPATPPNILFIAIDDLNDWVGCMDGHPQARTPHIDRLAERGVLFTNAHCQSPVCNPSRASLMSGLYPETTGIYFLNPPLWESEIAAAGEVIPRRFEREGYEVAGAGKLFHSRGNARYFPSYAGNFGGFGPYPDKKLGPFQGHRLWDWGAFPERDELMPDHKIATWTENWLRKKRERPYFLGIGFYTPHVPQYAPQKWIDRFPIDEIRLPETADDDLDDLSPYAIDLTRREHVAPTHEWVVASDQWKPLVQTYLACTAFTDAQLGRVLDALDARGEADDTIIVLFTDHGFHLGEKQRWAKRSLWQDGAGTPLIIAGPGISEGAVCDQPVQLLDLYPTLLDLAGLDADPRLEGRSLRPLLENPRADWPHLARTSFGPENVALISEGHRYIRYRDGSEELYDRRADPHEWRNLAGDPAMAAVLERHRAELPTEFHPPLGRGSTGHKAYRAAGEP
jgi:arylsulfatase A-like enzyme